MRYNNDVDDATLRFMFSVCGQVTFALVQKDDNGASQGFGYAHFTLPEEATRALVQLNGKCIRTQTLSVTRRAVSGGSKLMYFYSPNMTHGVPFRGDHQVLCKTGFGVVF